MIEANECTQEDPTPQVEKSPILFKYTNKEDSPYLDRLLMMFYQGCADNRVGIMESHNLETSEVEMILVGVELGEDGKTDCYPLARMLRAEEVKNYLAPDGLGGFYDPSDPVEREAAREHQIPFVDAVVAYAEKEDSVPTE